MRIAEAGNVAALHRPGPPGPPGPVRRAERAQTAEGPAAVPAESETVAPDSEVTAPRSKGVLRNLEEGHFKGVADLRLRMVHQARIEEAGISLAPPAEVQGEGRAYAKFLAAYQSLVEAPIEEPVSEDPPVVSDEIGSDVPNDPALGLDDLLESLDDLAESEPEGPLDLIA